MEQKNKIRMMYTKSWEQILTGTNFIMVDYIIAEMDNVDLRTIENS